MSLRDRLMNIARAEIRHAFRKLRLETDSESPRDDKERRFEDIAPSPDDRFPEQIQKFYANLELPVGAPPREIKSAYRKLVRDFHPDRHHGDRQRSDMASEIVRELRSAYEGLMEHWNEKP